TWVKRRGAGFTLLETVLATLIGSLVLAAAMSLFVAMSRAERTMARASRHMEEMAMSQQILRKSFMTMVLAGQDSLARQMSEFEQDGELTEDELVQLPRPRLLLEFDTASSIAVMRTNALLDGVRVLDPAGYGMGPQRLEITLPDKPVPESMRLFPSAWTSAPADDLVRVFDPSGVEKPENETGLRGCFELRPDGARERLMEGYGLVPARGLEPTPLLPAARRPPDGWTLWWRPVYGQEYRVRQQGVAFDIDRQPGLLAEAVPLIRGVRLMRWVAFAAEENPDDPDAPVIVERWPEYAGTTVEDIPGYMEVEIETTSGAYASWAFELGWSLADEYFGEDTAPPDDEEETTPDGQQPPPEQLNQLGGQS
ncbi:MAG: hypothetical protein K8E66_04535, partial [Phycisphaerales bacterium]|nr:hypothetical protein [Phycisphaerales bacterium]